jgi:twitching motility protein PilU
VGVDTHSWHHALKNTLRQAPDVILIGEIRDSDTMEHAITFAETGHLCLGTLHANSASQALDRVVNFFPDEARKQLLMDLSGNLRSIISQRLIPTEDGHGRKAAIEILINTPTIADRILAGEFNELRAIMDKSRELGMRTFDWALFELYNEGHISYEEALRNADSANELRLNIKLKSARGEPMVRHGGSLALDAMEEEAGEPSEKELWEARLGQEMQPQRAKAPEEHASTMQAIDQVRADRVLRMEKQRHKDDDELAILRKVKQA